MLFIFNACKRWPGFFKKMLIKGAQDELGDFPADPHFAPSYNPWDQRLCAVPDADLFKSIRTGKADVVTDHIETFTENGILLKSGKELKADIIITATGLDLLVGGGAKFSIDTETYNIPEKYMYRGLMLSDLPNAMMFTGYTNASWTLKVNLVSDYISRVIKHIDKNGYGYFVPKPNDPDMPSERLLNLNSGYILRSEDRFPKQGEHLPWKLYQNFFFDYVTFNYKKISDPELKFENKVA